MCRHAEAGTEEMVTVMWSHGGAGWAGWLLMSVAMVSFWVLVFAAIIALIPVRRDDGSHWRRPPALDNGLRDLDERLSRGDIDLEDYKVRRALLISPRQRG